MRLAAGVAAGGRRTRAEGRPRRRDVAAGQGAHARRAARDRPAVAPPGPRQRRDQRHQRQDHDRGDGGEHPRAHRRAARPQPRGGEHGGRDRQRAGERAPPARRARPDGRLRPLRGRRVLARSGGRGARAARDAARQPLPRPARPLRRAGDDRRPLGRGGGRARRRDDPSAQRRRPAGRRPGPGPRDPPAATGPPWPDDTPAPGVVYFGVDDDSLALPQLQHASDSKHCRRCGHAYTYTAVYLAHLGHYTCPNCGQQRPEPSVVATDVELRGIRSAAFTLRERRVELPLPGLYNVYNALGAAALTLSLGVELDDIVGGLEAVAPAFGRAERSTSTAARRACCWSRTRPARTRSCARSRSRAASWTCWVCSTTAPPTAATSAGCGTPTGSCWSAACGDSRPRAPAPRSSRCG